MSTLTIASPVHADAGLSYVQNVGRAARALLAALLAVRPHAEKEEAPVSRRRWLFSQRDESYDYMMPNLTQELAYIAARQM